MIIGPVGRAKRGMILTCRDAPPALVVDLVDMSTCFAPRHDKPLAEMEDDGGLDTARYRNPP